MGFFLSDAILSALRLQVSKTFATQCLKVSLWLLRRRNENVLYKILYPTLARRNSKISPVTPVTQALRWRRGRPYTKRQPVLTAIIPLCYHLPLHLSHTFSFKAPCVALCS